MIWHWVVWFLYLFSCLIHLNNFMACLFSFFMFILFDFLKLKLSLFSFYIDKRFGIVSFSPGMYTFLMSLFIYKLLMLIDFLNSSSCFKEHVGPLCLLLPLQSKHCIGSFLEPDKLGVLLFIFRTSYIRACLILFRICFFNYSYKSM